MAAAAIVVVLAAVLAAFCGEVDAAGTAGGVAVPGAPAGAGGSVAGPPRAPVAPGGGGGVPGGGIPPLPPPWPIFPPWIAPIDATQLYPDLPPGGGRPGAPAIPPATPGSATPLWNGLQAGVAPRVVKERFDDAQYVPPARNAPPGTITLRSKTSILGQDFDVNCNFQRDALVNVSLYAASPDAPARLFGRLGDALSGKYGQPVFVAADPNASLAAPVYEDTPWQVGRVRSQVARWQAGRTTITLLRAGGAVHLVYDTGLATSTDRL